MFEPVVQFDIGHDVVFHTWRDWFRCDVYAHIDTTEDFGRWTSPLQSIVLLTLHEEHVGV